MEIIDKTHPKPIVHLYKVIVFAGHNNFSSSLHERNTYLPVEIRARTEVTKATAPAHHAPGFQLVIVYAPADTPI
jgi:hypothetical protein